MELPKRKSIRLKGYDYSRDGRYFVTICTRDRVDWLGTVCVGQGLCSCRLSEIGSVVEMELLQLENRYDNLKIDKYTIMPNHIHIIVVFKEWRDVGEERREQSPRPTTLMDAMCAFKSITAKAFNKINDTPGRVLWQGRFYDHIIRDEDEYQRIWQYIDENPLKWADDCYYGKRTV